MKITIELGSQEEAIQMMKATDYLSFLEDFWQWLGGEGRESKAEEVANRFRSTAVIYGVTVR